MLKSTVEQYHVVLKIDRIYMNRDIYTSREAIALQRASRLEHTPGQPHVVLQNKQKAAALKKLAKRLNKYSAKLSEKLDIGRFIFERLGGAPWNTTKAFVTEVHRGGLELDFGIADPSGTVIGKEIGIGILITFFYRDQLLTNDSSGQSMDSVYLFNMEKIHDT